MKPVDCSMSGGQTLGLMFSRQPTGVGAAVAGAPAGAKASAPWRRRERPRGAALKPYRKFSHAVLAVLGLGGLAVRSASGQGVCPVPVDA